MMKDVNPFPVLTFRGVVRVRHGSPRAASLTRDLWLTRWVRQLAVRLLREAAQILVSEGYPFPMNEAARRIFVPSMDCVEDDVILATRLAREAIGEERDEHQLRAAADLLERGWRPHVGAGGRSP